MKIDDYDKQLLKLLQTDGRMTNQNLSEASAMSTSACWRRVKAMEDAKIIDGYLAIVNPEACGLNFHAIAQVQLSRHASKYAQQFIKAVQERSEILDCFATTGDADYHLRVRCKNTDAYNHFLETFLFKLEGILNVRTNLVLRQIKHKKGIPV